MKCTIYTSAKAFADAVLDILKVHEIQNNLFFKNIYNGIDSDDNSNMVMGTVANDDGKIMLTALRAYPHPLLIYETDNVRNYEAVACLCKYLHDNGIAVDLFMTEKTLAKSFAETYSSISGKQFYNNENLVLYLIDSVNDIPPISGSFRKAEQRDMYYLPYWYADFPPACKLGDYNLDNGIGSAQRHVDNGKCYIWEDDVPVSMAAVTSELNDSVKIAWVYTPPHLCGKGYSSACVGALTRLLLQSHKYCILYANCANPISNRVYQKLGYKEIFYYDKYKECAQ